jgi:phosphoserine aminotransferase
VLNQPAARPRAPHFSSGPCPKRPGWTIENLKDSCVGRSHRSKPGKARLKRVIDLTRELLDVPADYRIAIVPASDTGAVEMALWSLLGPRGVDVLAWESFSEGWVTDVTRQLKLADVRVLRAPYGELPDLGQVDFSRDVVFTWNGTTSGVRVPDDDWIKADRSGLTICDATSAAFAQALPMHRLDVVTFSWQKVLGGEAAHGMLILSPRAVERLQSYTPLWPMPKIFRMTNGGKLNEALFEGETINTPSMICVEDCLDALEWAKSIGGLEAMLQRADRNLAAIETWVERTPWARFLARDQKARSNTSVCITIADPAITGLSIDAQRGVIKAMATALEDENAAYDIAGLVPEAPPHLRIWAGSTVEAADLEALFPWLDWAFAAAKAAVARAA